MNTAFNILVVPSIILIIAGLITAVLRRASASLRHEIWAIAIFGATFLPAVVLLAPKWEIPVITQSTEVVVVASEGLRGDVTLGSGTTPTARAETPSQSAPPESGGEFLLKRTLWLGLVWCAGAVAVFVRFVFGILAVRRLAGHANVVDGDEWRPLLDELRSQLSIRRKVRVVVGTESFPPMTWGNVILLPAEAQHWNLERRRLVLAHELAHVRRRDGLVQAVVQLICAAHWFNPLIWQAVKRLRIERERACDDHVLNLGVDGHLYASHLVEVARVTRPRESSPATVSMAHPSQLETRIRAIMDPRTTRRPLSNFTVFAGYNVVAAVLILLATVRVTATVVPAPVFPPPPYVGAIEPVPSPKLQNPNLTRDERIAYADLRFGWNGRKGSETDRGHTWINHGRPDDVESHPASPDGKFAYDLWSYRHLPSIGDDVQFEFIDPSGTGEYRLAPKFNPPAVHFEQAKWAGTWKLNKDRSTLPQDSAVAGHFRSIESFTITLTPVAGGVTVSSDLTLNPPAGQPGTVSRTRARLEYTVRFGEPTDVRSIIPLMDQDGFLTFRPTADGLEMLSSTGTSGVRQVEIITFSASDDGRTLIETVNTFAGVQGVFERQSGAQ